jgi:hypothetical protein
MNEMDTELEVLTDEDYLPYEGHNHWRQLLALLALVVLMVGFAFYQGWFTLPLHKTHGAEVSKAIAVDTSAFTIGSDGGDTCVDTSDTLNGGQVINLEALDVVTIGESGTITIGEIANDTN